MGNLIDNAIKFTPHGGSVVVESTIASDAVTIVVDDSGPGIPKAERERVLERFYQILSGDDRANGLGLGLAICARVIEAHGGRLTIAESVLGGARVQMTLPRATKS